MLGWPIGADAARVRRDLNVVFAATSGLWGVLVTDIIQFGDRHGRVASPRRRTRWRSPEVGGLDGLFAQTRRRPRWPAARLPRLDGRRCRSSSCRSPCSGGRSGIPGPSPAAAATSPSACWPPRTSATPWPARCWFNVAHYALRPWPWIIVALCLDAGLSRPRATSRRALPHVDPALLGHDIAYPAMLTFLPAGLLGLMVAGLLVGLRLDHLDAPQLGHVVPGARLLPALPPARRRASAHYVLAGARGDRAADGGRRRG